MQESGHAWCIHVVGKSNYFQLVPESKIQARVNVIILQHCDLYDISHQNSNHQNSIASDHQNSNASRVNSTCNSKICGSSRTLIFIDSLEVLA